MSPVPERQSADQLSCIEDSLDCRNFQNSLLIVVKCQLAKINLKGEGSCGDNAGNKLNR